jgi:hypothetical protein
MIFNIKKFLLELIGISVVILSLIFVLVYLLIDDNKAFEIISGYIVSFVIFVLGFLSIIWAFKKSLKIFMATVLAGMFVRFVLIAIALFLFMKYTRIDILYFILSFFVFYIIYQFYEIRFINMKLSKGKKWLKFIKEAS